MSTNQTPRMTPLVIVVVISITVVGYFTGLQAPMSSTISPEADSQPLSEPHAHFHHESDLVLSATHYSQMAMSSLKGSSADGNAIAAMMKRNEIEWKRSSTTPVAGTVAQKEAALERRATNRAFDGAPPTIPHHVDQKSAQACIACHGNGTVSASLRIPRMSHPFLANCTQCHVESNPSPLVATEFRENTFVGLLAPDHGPRAYHKAPPQIPHPTWMRNDCMSCHGPAGAPGIRTSHPERKNCQQCHAPSAALDQKFLAHEPKFLAPPKVESSN